MNRLYTLLMALCMAFAASTIWAEPVNEQQARRIAEGFMMSHTRPSASLRIAHKAPRMGDATSSDKAAYYVFNAAQGGYVIVAGDDRAPSVLGYSDEGTFDPQEVPEAMQELLEGYAVQIEALDHGAKASMLTRIGGVIDPLVPAAWSQRAPYNILLPMVNGKHAAVGCVATAMAQVMYYWHHPARPSMPIPAYTSKALSIYMPQLPVVDFDWTLMQDTYLTSDTLSEVGYAAALLSQYCAQSIEMNFNNNSSSAYASDIPNAMINYFGYKAIMQYVQRQNFTTPQWENMLYRELAKGRPVVYRGSKKDSGHAFVCDGYDGNGMYHINWGWNGQSNGYFLLNVLNPDAQGTGSASGSYGYIIGQAMVIGIEPGTEMTVPFEVCSKYIELQSYTGSRANTSEDFSVTQLTHFINYTNLTISFDYGWALYQGNNMIQVLATGYKENLMSNYYIKATRALSFGSDITSGTYRIVPIYRERNGENWRSCCGSDINYIEVTINGNNCTFDAHGVSTPPSYECNDISVSGHMHPNRPVTITLNVTNTGNTRNDLIYMFASEFGGFSPTTPTISEDFYSAAFVDLENGASGDVTFTYTSETTGSVWLSFSLYEDGSETFASLPITISDMLSANLTGTAQALNVTDADARIITSDKFSVLVTANNSGTNTYNEDITIKLYKHTYGNYGTMVQAESRPVSIARRGSETVQFDLDNVMDGWKYFAKVYYYSEGNEVLLANVGFHTIIFPDGPAYPRGDVNGDGEVNIADVNAVIDIILNGGENERADVNNDGEINIADVNALIGIIQGALS